MAIDITQNNFESEVINSKLPVILDVYATWCGPCQQVKPIFEDLAKELKSKYKFGKLNIDESRDLAINLEVSSVPTFIFFKNGKIVGLTTGFMNKEAIKNKIEEFFK